jgi:hypothetical protein
MSGIYDLPDLRKIRFTQLREHTTYREISYFYPMPKDSFLIERLDGPALQTSQPLRRDDHQLFLITKCAVRAHFDHTAYTLSPGSLLLISKSRVHKFQPIDTSEPAHPSQPTAG